MVEAEAKSPSVLKWSDVRHHWWQWLLFATIVASAGLGIVYICYSIITRLRKHFKTKTKKDVVSSRALNTIQSFTAQLEPRAKTSLPKPSSFGVYLGDFSSPPTKAQSQLLRRSDLTVLDPFRNGVKAAITNVPGRHFLGRVDFDSLLGPGASGDVAIQRIGEVVVNSLNPSPFTGILLAGWEHRLSPAYLGEITRFIDSAGLITYLEVAPPDFLPDGDVLGDYPIAGLLIRNAAIHPDGEHRDFFDMEHLQPTVRAFVKESCLREFSVLMWERLDDGAKVSNATIKRAMRWGGFYSATTWIGSSSALLDAEQNVAPVEPLGAFEWLKEDVVMKAHSAWRTAMKLAPNQNKTCADAWIEVNRSFPDTRAFLMSNKKPSRAPSKAPSSVSSSSTLGNPSRISAPDISRRSIQSMAELMPEYDNLGVYPLGIEVSPLAFAEVLQAQIRFKNLGLLQPVDTQKITNMGIQFRKFHERYMTKVYEHNPDVVDAVREVSALARSGHLKIHLGLSPGFQHGLTARFWAVQHIDNEGTEVFVSRDAQDLSGTVLHAVLSNLGIPRDMCFEAEAMFAEWLKTLDQKSGLPPRMVQDINFLTPEERLSLLQQLSLSGSKSKIVGDIRAQLRRILIDTPTYDLLTACDSVDYLNGSVKATELIQTRFEWYDRMEIDHPDLMTTLLFFKNHETLMVALFKDRKEAELKSFNEALDKICSQPELDAWADLLALATFCAAKKAALDDVYLEVTDRNPLLNDQPDQAAVFSESFALGSRCDAYFDVSPSVFGKILWDRYRAHYNKKQPPLWNNGAPDFATAYGGANIDVDPDRKAKALPEFQRFTFLSVFAIPALVDIALLTTIGRGLYLSAYMTLDEQRSATIALMVSLLLSGATGTWIACGGSYYLVSMAFSAMNVFVLSRLIAGVALTFLWAVLGFLVMSSAKGIHSGIVFFLYLVGFTTYLTLFAAIASFQFPGTSFLAGRKIIMFCLPWLLVSPIITIWSGHDIKVYLLVFYGVLIVLFYALRRIGSRWVTWYQGLRQTNDQEIRKWYTANKAAGDADVLGKLSDPAALKVARAALLKDVQQELNRGMFAKKTQDELVSKLAADFEATSFLLDWYCRYSDVPRPIAYSSAWNIQTKVALNTLNEAQKGIRLHNAFIHWRQAGDEVGCGILYFIIALLDKWVELLTGTHLVGLTQALNDQFRMAVGFGLAYYLIGAVLIDVKAQELHGAVNISTPEGVKTLKELRTHQKKEIRIRRAMYRRTLFRFLTWHCWGFAFSTTLVWIFQASVEGMAMFFAYVLAYTGLLWYQYTKIFSGPFALKPLLTAVCLGIPIGIAMKKLFPEFRYSGVIALSVATWTAAILCLGTAKISMPKRLPISKPNNDVYHAYTKPWADPEWSQQELKTIFDNLANVSTEGRFTVNPFVHPGTEVKAILSQQHHGDILEHAFPDAQDIVELALKAWEAGQIELELMSLSKLGHELRAISKRTDSVIKLVVGVGKGAELQVNMRNNCQIIAELILHEVAEAYFKMPHDHAILAEQLVNEGTPLNALLMLAEETDRQAVVAWSQKEILKQQCLGLECNLHWDKLTHSTREYFLKRCLGEICVISEAEQKRLSTVLCRSANEDLGVHVSRCDLAIEVATELIDFANQQLWTRPPPEPELPEEEEMPSLGLLYYLTRPISYVYHTLGMTVKYFVVALIADLEWQREFDYQMKDQNILIRIPSSLILNFIWSYARSAQNFGLNFFLFAHRSKLQELWQQIKGTTVTQYRNKLVISTLDGIFTAFRRPDVQAGYQYYQYKGTHKVEPTNNNSQLAMISTYNAKNELIIKEEFKNGAGTNLYEYDYESNTVGPGVFSKQRSRIPRRRRCVRGDREHESIAYNSKGFVDSGSYLTNGNLVHFKLSYRKNAQFLDELLRGEFVMAHMSANVSWCAPPRKHVEKLDTWLPHAKVTRATFMQGHDTYECKWIYDHKFHPTINVTLNGQPVSTPPMIQYDWFGILKKPKYSQYAHEDPLFYSSFWKSNALVKMLGLSQHRVPISTSLARSKIWRAWKTGKDVDGVVARWLDEKLLRRDSTLAPYWRLRNRGNLEGARDYISSRSDAVMASADLDEDVSSWTPLAMKIGDLYSFGPGGDTILHTRAKDVGKDTNETLHVLAADNGTWPNEGGGVSACRRDLVNCLETIKWHMLCESATDFGVPKHQTEQNVLSLKVIPLWGLDFLTPTHGLLKNKLDAEVAMLPSKAGDFEIKKYFIPILTTIVKGARAVNLTSADLQQATRAFVNLNDYFEDKKHWSEVWQNDVTKDAWRQLWLADDIPNTKPASEWFDTELPTLGHFDTALELWLRYLFVFSIQVPEKIPAIFQTSHHSVSAAYGVVCKIKRGCQLQIWDHAIAWRETNMCLSSALCKLSPFVRNAVLGLTKLTSVLVLHHADVILPCADFFNPGWEVEVGSCQGSIVHRNSFWRKISPVVNGITDAEGFQPVKEIKTKRPTVTMLSHLWFCKDLKTAILAADIIVNEWGFKDYQLDVYGSIEKSPIYSNECQELIASKSLGGQVKLCGTANPLKVLEQTWLFLNSSLSEGLPLALGEAALTGAPVVCTDVGASLRVLSDPVDMSRYSSVVAPNDARALAKAQIKILAMLEEWGKYAGDDGPGPELPFSPTSEDVERITARMYEKAEYRRKLGMMSRDIVQKSFSGERYLREHEQMLWIGKAQQIMDTRDLGEVSDNPADIIQALQLRASLDDEVIPTNAVPTLRSSSAMSAYDSSFDRSITPVITEEWTELIGKSSKSSSRMGTRPGSRLSMATTETDNSQPRPTTGGNDNITALPRVGQDSTSRRSSWRKIGKMTITALQPSDTNDANSVRSQYNKVNGSAPTSPFKSEFVIDHSNGPNSIMNMEAPANVKHEKSAYRNLGKQGRETPTADRAASGRQSPGPARGKSPAANGRTSPGMEKLHSANANGRKSPAPGVPPAPAPWERGRKAPGPGGTMEKAYFT